MDGDDLTVLEQSPLVLDVARSLHARGWAPLPLPARSKSEPPYGYTGYAGKYPTAAQIERWTWDGNIAIRMPPDVCGVDVDVYHGGDATLNELMEKYGPLPLSVNSTSRDDGSGIALFRIPLGTTLAANPGRGIEMIQAHHRYMVVWPSIHPEGRLYQWVDDRSGEPELVSGFDAPPDIDELPELPWAWVQGLAVSKSEAARAATPDEVREFIDAHTEQSNPHAIKGIRKHLQTFDGSRHDTLVKVACWGLREAAAGYHPAALVIDELRDWWHRVMDDRTRIDNAEFDAALMWAVAQVATKDAQRVAEMRAQAAADKQPAPTVNTTTGEIAQSTLAPVINVASAWRNLPGEFWTARPTLEHIRQAAHSRARSADAVLLCTLARIAALTPPTVTLPAIVGGKASLNFLGAIVASSGAGKSSANAVARELVPIERKDVIADIPLGSGEGMTERFFDLVEETDENGKKRKVKSQVRTGALFYLDEGQALSEMGNRQGATLLPTLRAAWSGETIGQSNASIETHRVLRDHKYRMAIVVGFQVNYAAELLADTEGGTPQRFVYASAIDPTVPYEAPVWPGALHYVPPPVILAGTPIVVDDDIQDRLRRRQVMMQRGEFTPDPLDSHAELGRLKVAALLALLDERIDVNPEDWDLAGHIMRASAAVRTWVIEEARAKARAIEEGRIASAVRREAALEDSATRRALMSGAKAIGRYAHKNAGTVLAKRDLMGAVDSRNKKVVTVDDMIAQAVEFGWVKPEGDKWVAGESRPA